MTWSAFFLVIKQTRLRGSLTIYLHVGEKWNSWGILSAFSKSVLWWCFFVLFWFFFSFDSLANSNGYIQFESVTTPVLKSLRDPHLKALSHSMWTEITIFESFHITFSSKFPPQEVKASNPPYSCLLWEGRARSLCQLTASFGILD